MKVKTILEEIKNNEDFNLKDYAMYSIQLLFVTKLCTKIQKAERKEVYNIFKVLIDNIAKLTNQKFDAEKYIKDFERGVINMEEGIVL